MVSRKVTKETRGHANLNVALLRFCRMSFAFAILFGVASRISASEITTYKDESGRTVYVGLDDRELHAAVDRGGIEAAVQVIQQRKHHLPAIDEYIDQVALQHQVNPNLVRAVIAVESAWNPKARSRKGALGLMQLMPETAGRFGVRDPFDPKENIEGGVRYLRFLLDRFHGNLRYSLAAYNAGEGAVVTRGDVPPYEETQTYLRRIAMIYPMGQQQRDLSAGVISRSIEGNHIVYTNLE
jgi:soluble lytic murein transglycosylase-like protein